MTVIGQSKLAQLLLFRVTLLLVRVVLLVEVAAGELGSLLSLSFLLLLLQFSVTHVSFWRFTIRIHDSMMLMWDLIGIHGGIESLNRWIMPSYCAASQANCIATLESYNS